jgi:hypothetical protein
VREKKSRSPLQRLAYDYLIQLDTPEEERVQKLARGFSVNVDSKKVLHDLHIRTRPGGFVESEERRETMGRNYALDDNKKVSFWIATKAHGTTHSTLGNSYGEWELSMMKITDYDVVDAMKAYAKEELQKGRATEEAVAAFIAKLEDTKIEPIGR